MRRPLRLLIGLLAAAALLLVAWSGFALWRAHQKTPQVIEQARQGPLQLSDLSPIRKRWLLQVEDPGFYAHRGIDWTTPGQGNTNLTQGLVKRFYFDRFRPGFAKIEQVLIARFVLDPALTKDEQLRAYLNHTWFGSDRGRPIRGYQTAARHYFERDFRALGDRQFLSLLAMTIAPREFDPRRHPRRNAERVDRIERLLAGTCAPLDRGDIRYEACGA